MKPIEWAYSDRLMDKALEAQAKKKQVEKDLLPSSALPERIKDELLVRGPAQDALLAEHALTLTKEDEGNLFAEVMEANPKADAKELGRAFRALRVQAALTWHRNRVQLLEPTSLIRGAAKI